MTRKTLADEYTAEARRGLAACVARVKHCLAQLDDVQLWQRPRPSMPSVGDQVLHQCGRLGQRLLSAAGGRAPESVRPGPVPKGELLLRLEEAAGAADAVLAGLTADRLLEPRHYTGPRGGAEGTELAAVLRTLLLFAGHTQGVVFAARLVLGDAYRTQAPAAPPGQILAADDVVFEQGLTPPPAPRAARPPSDSPLHDHLLELEQEFQDQEEEGKL